MAKLVLAIDQGTTATTVMAIDSSLNVVARASTEILPTYPKYGWVEHDLNQIWSGTVQTLKKLMQSIDPKQVGAIGITNQRETVGAWDRQSGQPLAQAIVWQCRRTTERCEELKKDKSLVEKVKKTTGLVLDPYFSATKIEWFLNNISGLRTKVEQGNAVFGNIDTFLLYKLTTGKSFATDASNASRTMLLDLNTLKWDPSMLSLFGIPEIALPSVKSSVGVFGITEGLGFLPDGIPISGILGDQQAALFGQLCFEPGESKCTYGTGSFFMCNTGNEIRYSKNGLLTTIAWKMNDEVTYALEGSAFVAGAAVQFLRDNLGLISASSEIEPLSLKAKEEDMGDLVFVPSLTGLGAPHWEPSATGMIYGLTRGTQKCHIARAALEGIALQNDDLFTAAKADISPRILSSIKVDGGASANNFLIQLQANLAKIPAIRPRILDTTAMGAALAAGLAVGIWGNTSELKKAWQADKTFSPILNEEKRIALRNKWERAIRRILCK